MMRRTILVGALVAFMGCDEAGNDMELCRQVYEVYCQRAYDCDSESNELNTCLTYYYETCRVMKLHGGIEPTETEVDDCLEAIRVMDCGTVDPSVLDDCSFLVDIPDDAGVVDEDDGGIDAEADADAEVVDADAEVVDTDTIDAADDARIDSN